MDLPPNVKPIGCRWILKIKFCIDGSVEKFKENIVAKGYNQIEWLNYFDTYSPVAKLTTIRLVITLISIHIRHIHQLDVNNAYLHGKLQGYVYMVKTYGIKTTKPNQVCKLKKSLYGLKQVSRKWYEKLTSTLIHNDSIQDNADHSLFIKRDTKPLTILLVYVDDIIIAGNSLEEFDNIESVLHHQFKIKNMGQLKYFIRLEVAHSKKGFYLCQRK